MLVTKMHKIDSIEITYISCSFNTAKHNPINGWLFTYSEKKLQFPRQMPLKCLNNALCFCLAKMPGKKNASIMYKSLAYYPLIKAKIVDLGEGGKFEKLCIPLKKSWLHPCRWTPFAVKWAAVVFSSDCSNFFTAGFDSGKPRSC